MGTGYLLSRYSGSWGNNQVRATGKKKGIICSIKTYWLILLTVASLGKRGWNTTKKCMEVHKKFILNSDSAVRFRTTIKSQHFYVPMSHNFLAGEFEMGSAALEGGNKGNMLIMKVLEESKQFQVGSVVTRNPIYGWTKRKGGWPAWDTVPYIPVEKFPCSVTALKYHPKHVRFMGQGIIWVSPAKGTMWVIPASKTSWELAIFYSRTPGCKNWRFLPGMDPFRSGWNTSGCPCNGWSLKTVLILPFDSNGMEPCACGVFLWALMEVMTINGAGS